MAWEVETEMPIDEFYGWLAYLEFKSDLERKAAEEAKKKSKGRR